MIKYQEILNKNLLKVFIEILKEIEKNGLLGSNHLYITFQTNNPKTKIPVWLKKKYPNTMTIVIQHEYYNLSVNKDNFSIGLSFENKKTNLIIAFKSILSFADPSVNFGLNYDFNQINNKLEKNKKYISRNDLKSKNTSDVIEFTKFIKIKKDN